MYSMDDLLQLARTERVEELRLHVGKPPVTVRRSVRHVVEGPPITAEDAERFLLSIANTRKRREIRERGWAQFFYMFRRKTRFLVLAKVEEEGVGFDIE
jgi:Tfp pilus assembly pilus retraction ATPase PilT